MAKKLEVSASHPGASSCLWDYDFQVNTPEQPFSAACPLLATQIWSPGPGGQTSKEFLGSETACVERVSNFANWDPVSFCMFFFLVVLTRHEMTWFLHLSDTLTICVGFHTGKRRAIPRLEEQRQKSGNFLKDLWRDLLRRAPAADEQRRRGRFFFASGFFSNPSHFTVFEPCLFTPVGFLGGLVGNLNLRPRNRDHWKGSAELRACDFLLARECASSVVTDLSFIAEKLQILSLFHWSSHAWPRSLSLQPRSELLPDQWLLVPSWARPTVGHRWFGITTPVAMIRLVGKIYRKTPYFWWETTQLFPTSVCGVLVSDSVSRSSSSPPSSRLLPPPFTHNFVTHNIIFHTHHLCQPSLSHTIFVNHLCQPPSFHVAGTWQAHGRRGTWRGRRGTYGTGLALVARLGPFWSPVTPRHFAWEVWQIGTSTFVLRGRRGTYGTGLVLVARLGPFGSPVTPRDFCVSGVALGLRGRRGTWRHPPSFCVAGVALSDIHLRFAWQEWQRGTWRHPLAFCVAGITWHSLFVTHFFHTPSLSDIAFHTQLCHTPSFTQHLSRYNKFSVF